MKKDIWMPYLQPRANATARIFCFPFAGGAASAFGAWNAILPSWMELCAVQYPGREGRLHEACITDLDALLEMLVFSIEPYCDLPYVFFGHSFGALVAYELAKRMAARQNAPIRLFVSGRNAPNRWTGDPVHALPDPQLTQRLIDLNGFTPELIQCREMLDILLPIIRADIRMSETYDYREQTRVPCGISAFGGIDDPWVLLDGLQDWANHTTGSFMLRMMEGDHFFLRINPSVLVSVLVEDTLFELPELAQSK